MKFCTSYPPKRHYRSCDVIRGQLSFLSNNSWLEQDTGSKTHSSCLSRQDGSTDMQHDLFGSGHDLDLRSNFQHDLSRSTDNSFDASWREEHDAGKIKFVQGLSQKLLQKQSFRKNRLFWQFLPPGGKTVDGRSNLRGLFRKSVNRAIKCAFPGRCSFISFRAVRRFVENCRNLTYKSANFDL